MQTYMYKADIFKISFIPVVPGCWTQRRVGTKAQCSEVSTTAQSSGTETCWSTSRSSWCWSCSSSIQSFHPRYKHTVISEKRGLQVCSSLVTTCWRLSGNYVPPPSEKSSPFCSLYIRNISSNFLISMNYVKYYLLLIVKIKFLFRKFLAWDLDLQKFPF